MELTPSEQATLHFYEWERLLRGYYHFDMAVHLEPFYIPFKVKNPVINNIDDGKIPSFFDTISNAFVTEEPYEKESEVEDQKLAYIYEPTTDLVGFSLTFPKGTEIQAILFREWLSLISFTETPISFEIIGSESSIDIQIVSNPSDCIRIQSQIHAYFPHAITKPLEDVFDIGLDMYGEDVAIIDFGLSEEVMRPIQSSDSLQIDPLTSIIATMDALDENEVALFQILFQGVQKPWAVDMHYSVSDGLGGSFFSNSPEMPRLAQEKTNNPLFSVVMRIAVESTTTEQSEYLANEFIQNINTVSSSGYNKLIALNNEGYEYNNHLRNVFLRCSNRLGFIVNTKELSHFLHYPNRTILSPKLGLQGGKTKKLPKEAINQKYIVGINEHNGILSKVSLNDEMRLRHTHIIGATGTGKSTLIANMVLEDAEHGNGCAIFDPHGDVVDDILVRIPEHRINDVIIIDPSDIDYPIGFNLLGASSEAEKIVLSSDLVSSFKRHATAWGDNMTAVLSNAINTFLENPNGGTIIELKRFILEEKFRNEFLENVDDPSLHYYWKNEYPMVKKGIAPLLTRIDTFLRPKTVRYMLAQKDGIDFKACIEQKKILLIKLSQGLIGEENSYLLGSLFLAKLNQVALGRQNISKGQRHPFYLYLDEFQNFITPSIISILSGARKYGLGLTLVHQDLAQIDEAKILNAVVSNPHIRICFRLGDNDAKKLESGFSYFEQNDLQNLNTGQAIMRIGSSSNDCNIQTTPLPQQDKYIANQIRTRIVEQTKSQYCKERSEIEQLLIDLLPNIPKSKTVKEHTLKEAKEILDESVKPEVIEKSPNNPPSRTNKISKEVREQLITKENEITEIRDHRYIQNLIKKIGQERGYKATIEKQVKNNGRIDVVLEKDEVKIAFEISVTNTPEYEVKNITKCISNKYPLIVVVSKDVIHLNKIKKLAQKKLTQEALQTIAFIHPSDISTYLNSIAIQPTPNEEIVKGFRVTTSMENQADNISQDLKSRIARLFTRKK